MIDCSIIIVNFNTKELLMQCIKSLVSSLSAGKAGIKYQVSSIEIIIVDNNSTDGSVEAIRKYLIPNTKYLIHLIENQSNLGFAKAVNQAFRQVYTERSRSAQGGTMLLLNSDTIVKDGTLKKFIEFEKKVGPAIIGARMLNLDGTAQGSCFNLPTVKRAILEYWLGKKNYFSKYAPSGNEPVEVEAVSGGAMLISKGVIDKIGMLDERYFMYFEDLDFCRRAKAAKIKVYYLPSAEVIHEHGASGKSLEKFENQWKRLIPSSRIYNGTLNYYLINFVIFTGQKFRKIAEKLVLKK